MSKDTEKVFRDLEKYLSKKEIKSEQEFNDAVKDFMNQFNHKSLPKKGKDAWDYVDMAYEADNEQDALKYARKALQLDKNCLDAEVMITELTTEDGEELKSKYEKLIEKAEKQLKETDIFKEENMGLFWSILETRPYMRLRYSYIRLLIDLGKFKKAVKECEDMLLLSEGDNMGVRYLLMSLYSFFEDELNAIRLHKRYEEEPSPHMLLPLIALYYKLDNAKKAESYLKKLRMVNTELEEVFCCSEDSDDMIMDDVIESGMYRCGSKEEIMAAMTESAFLYAATAGFFPWMTNKIAR